MKLKSYLPGLVFLATLVAAAYAVRSGMTDGLLSRAWIDREVRGKGLGGGLLFIAVGGIATSLAVPRHLVSFLGGYAFGLARGTLLALAATEAGCVLTFFYARAVGRPLVKARLGQRVARMEDFLATNPLSMTLLIRLMPWGNNLATSLAAGVSRVPPGPFLLGSLLGYLPLTFIFALAGSGVETGAAANVAVAALCFVASVAIGAWLYRRYRRDRAPAADVDDPLAER